LTSKILIVGAGIAGLSLAQWLKRFGLDFEIIEKKSSEDIEKTGIVLPFNAVREIKKLGIFDRLADQYHQAANVTYCKNNGKVINIARLTDPPFENDQFIALERQALNDALREGLQKKVRYNTELLSARHDDDSVRITCTNELLNGSYDLLVAADGLNSLTRQENFEGQELIRDHNVVCWRFVVAHPDHGLQPLQMVGQADSFMVFPISSDALYCYGHAYENSLPHPLGDDPLENLKRVFSGYRGPLPDILERLDGAEIIAGRLQSVIKPCFFDRRIAFVGDAANGCSPMIQQGAALALEGSRCLADALAMQNVDQALMTYHERRVKKVERIIRYADAPLSQFRRPQSWMGRGFHDIKIKTLGPPNVQAWRKLATERLFTT
jgi:2-polyprenyl-6-methoxyphenol hydroxylase-like FAD-dependent oxidoreductase|tara:strand:+ start:1250 stop:2392 length:1143 start_codon:yes stop_codon:yes gene_type:complete